ncbi:hypothetical protein [Pontiella sulfatireligans]|uniref:Uncharacterized protein n=1 Tax=Pontiella sulfatireligans TaxID=2750658 RepID=A0A6C2UQL5_9BACT|nr:hypothetical protein [Pontiella sulfatireligans]VGO21296.1 hypothetical protein SCARR_03368 [Pontiella sulfatireligans]
MKTGSILVTAILMMCSVSLYAQEVIIDSLDSNGKLTASVPSNSVYTVEWSGALTSPTGWQKDWSHLRDSLSTNGIVDVEVPMAFRLTCWTNGLFLNAPVGRTYRYSITNQANQTWIEEVQVMGDTYMPLQTNNYRTIWTEEWYNAPDEIPDGAQSRGAVFLRVDEDAAYVLDSELTRGPMQEDLVWENGPVGTTWSFVASSPHTTIHSEIVATNVTVSIGTTNYTGCIQIDSVGDYELWLYEYPDRRYSEWIQPGGYVVKRENYWVHEDYTNVTPVVYELQGWTDQ